MQNNGKFQGVMVKSLEIKGKSNSKKSISSTCGVKFFLEKPKLSSILFFQIIYIKIIGLQKLRLHQLDNLRYCLPHYRFYGTKDVETYRTFTSVAVLRSSLLRVQRNGSFSFTENNSFNEYPSRSSKSVKEADTTTSKSTSDDFASTTFGDSANTVSYTHLTLPTKA